MKALLYTLLILGGAFAAYDYFGAPVGEKLIFTQMNVPEPVTTAQPKDDAPPSPKETPAPPDMPPAPPEPAMAVQSAPPSAPAAVIDNAPKGFVPPKYDPMEKLTENWTKIPASAFPRPVTLQKATMFKMGAGGSTIAAGAKAFALGFQNKQLTLAPTATSTARAQVSIDDTDLKASLLAGYETWKLARNDRLHMEYDRRKSSATAEPNTAAEPAGGSVDPAGKPVRSPDGKYPLLLADLKAGSVTEVKAENIHNWGDPAGMMHQGKAAWAIHLAADVNTIFGLQPVEIDCIVRSGRVVGWFYSGSGEPVP